MKKILSLVLCIIFVFSLTACGGNTKKSSNHEIDIKYYANLGQINDVQYKLGGDVDSAQESLSADEGNSVDEHGHEKFYYDYQSGDYTVLTDGTVCCCYKTDDKDNGITHIVKYDGAYGFNQGAISTQVRDTMSDMGYTADEREAKNGELFFLPASAGLTVLEYKIDDATVLFVFQEHALSATVIYK